MKGHSNINSGIDKMNKRQILENRLRKMIREELIGESPESGAELLLNTKKRLIQIKKELDQLANELSSVETDAETAVHKVSMAVMMAIRDIREIYESGYDDSDYSEMGAPTSR
jgi:archaellum component FlaC